MNFITKQTQAEISMLMIAFIWGTSFVVVKNTLSDISPFTFLGLRFLLAFFIIYILAYKAFRNINVSTITRGCLLGFFLLFGYGTQTVGLQYTTSSNAGFITSLSVVLVPLVQSFTVGPVPSRNLILCVAAAGAGILLIVFPYQNIYLNWGDLLMLFCAVGFALQMFFVGLYSPEHNPVAITGIQLLFVGLSCSIIGIFSENWPHYFTPLAVISILVTSLLATSLAFFTQMVMQSYTTPTRFALILTAEPLFAAAASYFWAGETFTPQALTGALLIVISMIISIYTRTDRPVINSNI
ncbi:MAG: DMT family transporter [Syntrophomonadaceae bacterium]|nr:DMT family transporter [Syntrophomonadaceae bacterium]